MSSSHLLKMMVAVEKNIQFLRAISISKPATASQADKLVRAITYAIYRDAWSLALIGDATDGVSAGRLPSSSRTEAPIDRM